MGSDRNVSDLTSVYKFVNDSFILPHIMIILLLLLIPPFTSEIEVILNRSIFHKDIKNCSIFKLLWFYFINFQLWRPNIVKKDFSLI